MATIRSILKILPVLAVAFALAAAAPLRPGAAAPGPEDGSGLKEIPVPVIHVRGSHYEVGRQIGDRLKANLVREVADLKSLKDWERIRAEASLFLAYSRKYVPEYVAEIQGAADAAGLAIEDLFPTVCEEIGGYGYPFTRGCSDLIASGDVTADGSVLAAHNNDTGVSTQERVTIIHYEVDGEPGIVAVGYGGLGISVGYNSAGISLTGNQVDANDMRVGVPRFLLVRKILAARTVGDAIEAAILKERASDYNQVIADANGEIYSVEGSATDYAALYATDGYLVHTNHSSRRGCGSTSSTCSRSPIPSSGTTGGPVS
jgi:isopenicillin-N N-acyltransferase-like protein